MRRRLRTEEERGGRQRQRLARQQRQARGHHEHHKRLGEPRNGTLPAKRRVAWYGTLYLAGTQTGRSNKIYGTMYRTLLSNLLYRYLYTSWYRRGYVIARV